MAGELTNALGNSNQCLLWETVRGIRNTVIAPQTPEEEKVSAHQQEIGELIYSAVTSDGVDHFISLDASDIKETPLSRSQVVNGIFSQLPPWMTNSEMQGVLAELQSISTHTLPEKQKVNWGKWYHSISSSSDSSKDWKIDFIINWSRSNLKITPAQLSIETQASYKDKKLRIPLTEAMQTELKQAFLSLVQVRKEKERVADVIRWEPISEEEIKTVFYNSIDIPEPLAILKDSSQKCIPQSIWRDDLPQSINKWRDQARQEVKRITDAVESMKNNIDTDPQAPKTFAVRKTTYSQQFTPVETALTALMRLQSQLNDIGLTQFDRETNDLIQRALVALAKRPEFCWVNAGEISLPAALQRLEAYTKGASLSLRPGEVLPCLPDAENYWNNFKIPTPTDNIN